MDQYSNHENEDNEERATVYSSREFAQFYSKEASKSFSEVAAHLRELQYLRELSDQPDIEVNQQDYSTHIESEINETRAELKHFCLIYAVASLGKSLMGAIAQDENEADVASKLAADFLSNKQYAEEYFCITEESIVELANRCSVDYSCVAVPTHQVILALRQHLSSFRKS